MKKYLYLLSLCFILLACSSQTKETFVVGFTDYPPLGFKDENQEIVGFDIDLATEVFNRLNMAVSFQYINWDAKILELNADSIDAIWNGFSVTEERKQEVLFTDSYLNNSIVVITKKDDTSIETIADLSGKYIAVEAESSGQHALQESIDNSLITINRFTTINEALLDLKAGNSDCVVADELYARYLIGKSDDYQIVQTISLQSEEYAIGLRMDDVEMQTKINEVLQELKEDGTLASISMKWFNEDLTKQ